MSYMRDSFIYLLNISLNNVLFVWGSLGKPPSFKYEDCKNNEGHTWPRVIKKPTEKLRQSKDSINTNAVLTYSIEMFLLFKYKMKQQKYH